MAGGGAGRLTKRFLTGYDVSELERHSLQTRQRPAFVDTQGAVAFRLLLTDARSEWYHGLTIDKEIAGSRLTHADEARR